MGSGEIYARDIAKIDLPPKVISTAALVLDDYMTSRTELSTTGEPPKDSCRMKSWIEGVMSAPERRRRD
jgi:hypothetical protein